jgi:hypothetical protein
MSSLSLEKFGNNLPVSGIVALSQVAVGFGVGLLLADKLDRSVREKAAIALIGAGLATVIPVVAGIINNVSNRPASSRRVRRQLESIRDDTGLSNGYESY